MFFFVFRLGYIFPQVFVKFSYFWLLFMWNLVTRLLEIRQHCEAPVTTM